MIDARLDRIGVVMMSAVGDVVHVLPLLHALKRRQPTAHVTWVLQPGPATLVHGHPLVDEILLFDRKAGLGAFLDIRRELSSRPFDLVINLQVYLKAGIITGLARAPVKVGFDRARARDANWLFTTHRIPPHAGQHVQDQYLEFLAALGVPAEPLRWGLGPWEGERSWQRDFFAPMERPVAAIIVGTSKPDKDWIAERWATVCDALWHDFGMQPVLCGGESPGELASRDEITRLSSAPVIGALGSGLRRLTAILDGAALVLSPDTGPLHISVAIDQPVISLIGYSNPKRVGPYRKFHDLMIDAYGDPGENYPVSMENRTGRMSRISTRDVIGKIERWRTAYANYSRSPDGRLVSSPLPKP